MATFQGSTAGPVALLAVVLSMLSLPWVPAARATGVDAEPIPPAVWAEVDRDLAEVPSTARQRALGRAQVRFNQMVTVISGRVEQDFIPWYASFARRKLEELQAYNHFATDKIREFATGEVRDSGTPALIATFEHEFSGRVLKPAETREAMRVLARDTVADYATAMHDEFRRIQRQHAIPFEHWVKHLETLPPMTYVGGDGRTVAVPFGVAGEPGPVWGELAAVIDARLMDRVGRLPPVGDPAKLVTPDGVSIFAVGQNVMVYFSTYVVYWILLLILIQSGVIPVSLFGALIGWIVWEIFAWGSWIGYEALGFEETRVALATTIQAHTDVFFTHSRAFIGDFGDSGPFRVFHQIERSLAAR